MADNVQSEAVVTPGTNWATDELTGPPVRQVPYTKLMDGTADGTAVIPGDATNGLDVDVTRLPALVAGTANIGDVDIASPLGAGTEAAAVRVTIATDSTGLVSVDDNSGSLTVDGTVTANAGTGTFATDPIDRAARDLGKVDVASLDQYVPEDVDSGVGVVNALPVVLKVSGALGVSITGDAANGLDVDVTRLPALVAGTANIGDVDVASIAAGDNNIGNVDIVTGPTGASALQVQGTVAHDGVDAQNPVGVGYRAIDHGTNPTAVAAADRTVGYANRAGVPFVIGGHPNIVTVELAATAAQTDVAVVTVGAGLKIVVTQIQMTADNANTVDVGFRVGFGAVNTPTTTGVVLTHPGVAAGSGISRGDGSGILGVGADGEDLRVTSEVPTTGSIRILVSYFTIES